MTGTLGELGQLSEGVGTPLPFEQIGAPWIDAAALTRALNEARLNGVRFRATSFRPRYGTFSGQVCSGAQIYLTGPRACSPARVSATILETLARLYPERALFQPREGDEYAMFVKALGDGALAAALARGGPFAPAEEKMERDLQDYLKRRERALIYR